MGTHDLGPEYDREIARLRATLDLPPAYEPYDGPDDGEPVQLSVRISPRLRHEIAQAAKRRGQAGQAFVSESLGEAVRVAMDPVAGLAAGLAANFGADLGQAVESGEYSPAAAEVDRRESEWTDW